MSQPRRRKPAARPANNKARRPTGRDFWGSDDREEEPPALIRMSDEPTAMIRSLGPPPLPSRETVAEHYFTAVYDKAASLAVALAAASGLLDTSDTDDE
jgi:hypothetical protein